MEYNQHSHDFKNLLNRTINSIRFNEPNNIEMWVKALLNSDNIKLEFESRGKSLTSNYSKTADKVIEFLLHAKFIESCGDNMYVLTEDRGIRLKKAGTFEAYYEILQNEKEKGKNDAAQSDLLKALDKQVKEQQVKINAMELAYKPWAFKIAIAALILSLISLLRAFGVL